jgi:hypothetical protein
MRVLTPLPLPPKVEDPLFARRHRITVEEYHRMADAGIFGPEPRFELIEGVIVEKMTKNPPHTLATQQLETILHRIVPAGWFVTAGNPVRIPALDTEPEPDLQVVRGQPRDHQGRHEPRDVGLLIEVSDTSYTYDRHTKWPIYATARIACYWILDLNRRVLEVHTDPTPQGWYGSSRTLGPDDAAAIELDGHEVGRVAVRDILP